jgi:hypothetical protein
MRAVRHCTRDLKQSTQALHLWTRDLRLRMPGLYRSRKRVHGYMAEVDGHVK